MRTKFLLFTSLFLCCSKIAWAQEKPLTLQEKFADAQIGDYIITLQEGNYSLLSIRSLTQDILLLEEISVPEKLINLKKIDWKEWVEKKAPGHTSWTLYEIDRKSGNLIECFSYTKNGWLYLDQTEQFLTKLLTLPLLPVPDSKRRKIGPHPLPGETDQRSVWNPALVIDGKKIEKPAFSVLKAQWPDDGSRLALSSIELYFSKQEPDFPFPYWLEVQSPHYAFKMRSVDSGHGLCSPVKGSIPRRLPHILGTTQKGTKSWKLSVQTPLYFQKLNLFALDLTEPSKETIPIPFSVLNGKKNEELILEISSLELSRLLKVNHRYQWVLIPDGSFDIYVESEESFYWK